MRLFVALDVPPEVRDRLDDAVAPLRGRYPDLRWTRPSGWHLTLAFLGAVDDDRVPDVEAAVAGAVRTVDPSPLELRLAAAGHFGRRVLWTGVADRPEGAVTRLGTVIQQAVTGAGLPCDEKPVHPHVTLARAPGRGRLPRGVVEEVPTVDAAWTVRAADVWSSVTGPSGARYERVARVGW